MVNKTRLELREMLIAGALLTVFALVGAALVAFTHEETAQRIRDNERATLLAQVNAILPADRYNNDPLTDVRRLTAPESLGSDDALPVYRARKNGQPVAAIFTTIAPDGYNGAIKLLVGIYADGTVAGIRVLSEQETPGLGDNIESSKTDWLKSFEDKSLGNPPQGKWKVKKDGGAFDSFTGATITPRAVVKAIRKTLLYFREHRDAVFASRDSGNSKG